MKPAFSIIIPTYNEARNILFLIQELQTALSGAGLSSYEILVMDDNSPDGTADKVNALKNPQVRAINRAGLPRGLSQAVLHGFQEARGEVFVVMDADFSHPPAQVPALLQALDENTSVAVGSRYIKGGGIQNWPLSRRVTSLIACLLARPWTPVHDSTSGFFAVKKSVVRDVALNPLGFKIGLEVFVKGRHGGEIKEVPYVFTDRREGQSKLNQKVIFEYLKQLSSIQKKVS